MRYTVEAFTPGMSPWTLRATAVGEMWPSVRMTSATIARRWGVMRRPRLRSISSTSPSSAPAAVRGGGPSNECSEPLQVQRSRGGRLRPVGAAPAHGRPRRVPADACCSCISRTCGASGIGGQPRVRAEVAGQERGQLGRRARAGPPPATGRPRPPGSAASRDVEAAGRRRTRSSSRSAAPGPRAGRGCRCARRSAAGRRPRSRLGASRRRGPEGPRPASRRRTGRREQRRGVGGDDAPAAVELEAALRDRRQVGGGGVACTSSGRPARRRPPRGPTAVASASPTGPRWPAPDARRRRASRHARHEGRPRSCAYTRCSSRIQLAVSSVAPIFTNARGAVGHRHDPSRGRRLPAAGGRVATRRAPPSARRRRVATSSGAGRSMARES